MSLAARVCLLAPLALSLASADSLTVVNPNFAAVSIQCSRGDAYQSYMGGNCSDLYPEQDFNSGNGIGWIFLPYSPSAGEDGLTNPNSGFNPPSFTGLPFSQAAILQGPSSAVWQVLTGLVPGALYTLSFYLGSRYASGAYDGNQTVVVTVDSQVIGTWPLVSFTPFTLQTVSFTVASGGFHTLKFAGTVSGDHTAFFSGVSITTVSGLTVSPSSAFPGVSVVVSGAGFDPLETVTLYGYGSVKTVLGTTAADAGGNATMAAHIPQTPFGNYGLQAIGSSSGHVLDGTLTITPQIAVSPKSGMVGDTLTAVGLGFGPDEAVFVNWLIPPTPFGHSTTGRNGSFSGFKFIIPSGAPPGSNTVIVTGQRTGAVATAAVTVR